MFIDGNELAFDGSPGGSYWKQLWLQDQVRHSSRRGNVSGHFAVNDGTIVLPIASVHCECPSS